MARSFTRAELESRTVPTLRSMCVYELGIPGMTKKRKNEIIDAILAKYGSSSTIVAPAAPVAPPSGGMQGLEFTGRSVLTKPGAAFGSRSTTTIHVSCGASSGNFPVAGKTVLQVGEYLREVLNVDRLSTGLVNGREVPGDYVLKEGDNLEFLKPAGKKG